jgi:hypothetical protein
MPRVPIQLDPDWRSDLAGQIVLFDADCTVRWSRRVDLSHPWLRAPQSFFPLTKDQGCPR